jgi:hypothetical protein
MSSIYKTMLEDVGSQLAVSLNLLGYGFSFRVLPTFPLNVYVGKYRVGFET